ncbi:archaeosortase/exosortase family protein [Paracrocinitomix mangrovi]|uniref:exosortase X n=1 Tax=Paracrocinitomix mangrovi TaxID=2862509 RepID=UPI001C8DEC92|nr:archaeosortase/exosortase family protein [Paracrocinitomix mangrovi]UKN01557.1 archaeosortase/exosortase family protein [Paracrocinitomix mangrovi]
MKDKFTQYLKNPIFKFLFFAGIMYISWLLIYYFLITEHTSWDYHLDHNIAYLSQQFMQLFGVETFIDLESDHVLLFLTEGNLRAVMIGDECNGFKLFAVFSIFILAFPGKWKAKMWFVPLGMLIIHLANIIRVCALLLIYDKYPEYLDFNHLYTFTIFVYAIILILWLWYIKKFSLYAKKD